MAEQKETPKGYFIGEVETSNQPGIRTMIEVIAKPDGTGLTDKGAIVEILNKLDEIHKLLKQAL